MEKQRGSAQENECGARNAVEGRAMGFIEVLYKLGVIGAIV